MARTKRSARTSQEIGEEIAKLQSELERARQDEKAEVIAKMKVAVAHYGITAADMGFTSAGKRALKANGAKGAIKPKKAAAPAKFKDDAGNSWSGFGRKPKWYVDALAAGKTADELRV